MKKIILIAVCIFGCSFQVLASEGSGQVEQILVHSYGGNGQGTVMFKMQYNADKPDCSTAGAGRDWAFSLENEHGKAIYSLSLTAQSQQRPISVKGACDCAACSDRERSDYLVCNE